MKATTTMLYRAFWQDDHTRLIFRDARQEEIPRRLPSGCRVAVDTRNTIGRLDGGDEYEFAFFEKEGRLIVVIPEPRLTPSQPAEPD
jgi:hypothetical protein